MRAVLGRDIVEVVRRDRSASTGLVIDDDVRITRHVPAQKRRERLRVDRMNGAGPASQDNIDRGVTVEIGDRVSRCAAV